MESIDNEILSIVEVLKMVEKAKEVMFSELQKNNFKISYENISKEQTS
jgi:hypothetical protein